MKNVNDMVSLMQRRLEDLATGNAVVAAPISVGERHVVPLVELSMGLGGGGASAKAEAETGAKGHGAGVGGGAGGGVSACPVAVVVVDNGKVTVTHLGN